MKLIGKMKKDVANASDNNEVKEIIAKAGVILNDEELSMVTGAGAPPNRRVLHYAEGWEGMDSKE